MSRDNIGRSIAHAFLAGALWGAAAALFETVLFNSWFRVGLQQPFALLELSLNYALYFGTASLLVWLVLRLRAANRRGMRAAKVAEAFVGCALVVGVVVNFLRIGPMGLPLRSPGTVAVSLGALIVTLLGAWVLLRLPRNGMRVVRGMLVMWVLAAMAWPPLFGPYQGRLRGLGEKAPSGSPRNVVLIVTDTERADFLGCYGGEWNASPASDRAAASGTMFLNHVAQSTWTLPSVASLLTGRFPSSHGAVAHALPISSDAATLADAFQQHGYRTGAFTENFHILPRNGFGRGFDDFWAIWLPWSFDQTLLLGVTARAGLPTLDFVEKRNFPADITSPEQVNWDARVTTDRALQWLEGLGDAPFLAYIHYMGPHGPYGPPEFLLDIPAPDVRVTDHPRPMGGGRPLGEAGAKASPEAIADMKTLYAADILYVERQIERILGWLADAGRLDETVVVLTSDHGEEFYEHEAWNHGGSAFNEVLQVPFIISAPGLVPAGKRIESPTRHVDVMPTLLDLLGLEEPEGVQGISLRPLLDGTGADTVPAFTEVYPLRPEDSSISSLVKGRFKIIEVTVENASAVMLFDIQDDPMELRDLQMEAPDLRDSLLTEMDLWNRVAHEYDPDSEAAPLNAQQLKALKALGYIK